MSLNVMARVQAAQFGAAQESGDVASARKDVARTQQLASIDKIKDDKVGAVDQKQIQEKKGIWGTIIGAAVAVAAVALVAVTFGAALGPLIVFAAVALGTLTAAGQKVGHDVWGKVNALEAAALTKSAALEKVDLGAETERAAEAGKAIQESADDAAQIERFSRQLRMQRQALAEEERAS